MEDLGGITWLSEELRRGGGSAVIDRHNGEDRPYKTEYDWPEKMVYVTPGSHRVFTSSIMNGGKEKLIRKEDRHYVFVRSKAIVDRQALCGPAKRSVCDMRIY